MSTRRTPTGVHVSIQDRGAENAPWEGHLATGVLVDRDKVLVPGPVDALLDEIREFEVLIFRTPLRSEDPIERLRPTRVEVLRSADDLDRALAVILSVGSPSRYLPIGTIDGCPFDEALANSGRDIWQALERLDLVTREDREPPAEDILRALPALEREQRRPWRREVVLPPPPPYWCLYIFPFCQPCPPY